MCTDPGDCACSYHIFFHWFPLILDGKQPPIEEPRFGKQRSYVNEQTAAFIRIHIGLYPYFSMQELSALCCLSVG